MKRPTATNRRGFTDNKYAKRCEAFEVLGDKNKLEKVLKFTQMCRSVTLKKKCYHKNCRFAHSIEQLVKRDCRFGLGCKFVKSTGNGNFVNQKFGSTGKTCACYHPQEHDTSFCKRMNLKHTPKVISPKPTPHHVTKTTTHTPTNTPTTPESVWSMFVNKSEYKDTVTEVKDRMTRSWNQVVISTLTKDEKSDKYGIGSQILGDVLDDNETVPVIPTVIRKPWDKRGLGFSCNEIKPTNTVLVTAPGFSWVKGKVLRPKHERKQRWDVVDPKVVKMLAAVAVINKKISVETTKDKAVDINTRLAAEKARAKAVDINIRLAVEKARAKAIEINERLRADRKEKTWTKVTSSHKHSNKISHKKIEKSKTVTFRVPKDKAEIAMLSVIQSGITDFRIEIIR